MYKITKQQLKVIIGGMSFMWVGSIISLIVQYEEFMPRHAVFFSLIPTATLFYYLGWKDRNIINKKDLGVCCLCGFTNKPSSFFCESCGNNLSS